VFIREHGFNGVRIPVPHFIFDDMAPFVGCIEYLDRAFRWANETGLKILIDLHTARDCQNGFDNGGIKGVCKWHLKAENIEHTITVLEGLARRYRDDAALYGIECLNEPISEQKFRECYPEGVAHLAHDPAFAEGSCAVPDDVLEQFYLDCYRRLRAILKPETAIVFHDGFRLMHWKAFFRAHALENVVLDAHMYHWEYAGLMPGDTLGHAVTVPLDRFMADIREMRAYVPIVIGEWCVWVHDDLIAEPEDTDLAHEAIVRAVAATELYAFEQADGWFFWSYKVPGAVAAGRPGWDARAVMARGWLPSKLGN